MSTRQRGYAISVEAVTLDRGGRRIIDDVSLTVDQPGITAIIGPNGAGKSSLLAVMAGLLEADTGNRKFTNAAGEVAAITRIGFMLQRPVLLRRSLRWGWRKKVNCRHCNYRKGNANGWHWRG